MVEIYFNAQSDNGTLAESEAAPGVPWPAKAASPRLGEVEMADSGPRCLRLGRLSRQRLADVVSKLPIERGALQRPQGTAAARAHDGTGRLHRG